MWVVRPPPWRPCHMRAFWNLGEGWILGILALGGILVVAEGSAIAPFIYALF